MKQKHFPFKISGPTIAHELLTQIPLLDRELFVGYFFFWLQNSFHDQVTAWGTQF
jgi:hypothetical protein